MNIKFIEIWLLTMHVQANISLLVFGTQEYFIYLHLENIFLKKKIWQYQNTVRLLLLFLLSW